MHACRRAAEESNAERSVMALLACAEERKKTELMYPFLGIHHRGQPGKQRSPAGVTGGGGTARSTCQEMSVNNGRSSDDHS